MIDEFVLLECNAPGMKIVPVLLVSVTRIEHIFTNEWETEKATKSQ